MRGHCLGFSRATTILCLATACLAIASILTAPSAPPAPPASLLTGAQLEPGILNILQRSCADCHSPNTRYPWYSYVAPVSWLIRNDVTGGREHLDLSRWQEYPLVRRERALSEIANQVKDRDMPLGIYAWMHPAARLSDADVDAVFRWTQQERARLIASSAAPQ